jgi:hypothetical protein
MKARHDLPRYDLNLNSLGVIEAGNDIAFKNGTCGASNPHLLYACYLISI